MTVSRGIINRHEIWAVLRHPQQFLRQHLSEPQTPHGLLVGTATPLAAISGLAVLLRSVVAGSLMTGLVLGLGAFVLKLGAWLVLALVLPALARQFRVELTDRQGFALATFSSVPMWLAGILLVVPDDYWLVFVWMRGLAFLCGLFGLHIMQRGFSVLELNRKARNPLVVAVAIAYTAGYSLLYALLGVASQIVLFVVSPPT